MARATKCLHRMSHEKISKTSTTYLSGMGIQTLQYDVKKIPCSFGEGVKAQVIFIDPRHIVYSHSRLSTWF